MNKTNPYPNNNFDYEPPEPECGPWDENEGKLNDPFMPDWSAKDVPADAEWSTVDGDGYVRFWREIPSDVIIPSSDCPIWWSDSGQEIVTEFAVEWLDIPLGCDFRDSLRHRPQVQP